MNSKEFAEWIMETYNVGSFTFGRDLLNNVIDYAENIAIHKGQTQARFFLKEVLEDVLDEKDMQIIKEVEL